MHLPKPVRPTSLLLLMAVLPAFVISCAAAAAEPIGMSPMAGFQAASDRVSVDPKPVATPTPKPVDKISIAAVGDIMMGSPFPNDSRMPPNDGRDLLAPAYPILRSADIAFGNLEGPLADGGTSAKCGPSSTRCFAFRMPTHYANYLKTAGFDVMSVANNHAGDFGAAGRASTRTALDKVGIKYAGSDRGAYSTAYLTVGGKKVAFIGFATNSISLNVNNLAAARAAVRAADKQADIVVVSCHCGAEGPSAKRVPYKTEIFYGERRGNLRSFAHAVIDAGADLVLGHGPHVLRGMEIYKDRLIAYSLGNFATYGWFRLQGDTAESMVLTIDLAPDGSFLDGAIHPFKLMGRGLPTADKSDAAIATIRTLSRLDFSSSAPQIGADGTISTPSATADK